jgi:hypothetical protein
VNLYLDVDGAIRPVEGKMPGDFSDWIDESFITWSPSMVARIGALPVDIHWLTTWRDQANDLLCARFGWPAFPVLERRREALWWKLEALMAAQRHDEPFIWIDDELDERRGGSAGIIDDFLERFSAPYLLVSPNPHTGISLADLDGIDEFIKRTLSRD